MLLKSKWALSVVLFGGLVLFCAASVQSQDLFKEPESVAFDSTTNRYFISNADDGKIIVIDEDGEQSVYNETLSSCRGLFIDDSLLYATGAEGIVVIDITTDVEQDMIVIEGRTFLKDVTCDTSGYLYVTDSSQGKIYKIRKSDYFYTDFATGLTGIKGVLFVKELNILYYCTGRDIKSVNLVDSTVTDIIRTYHSQLNGLATDSLGYIYFSSWGSDGVFRYDPLFLWSEADTVSVGHTDPADIYYNIRDDILVVPNYNANTVDFVPNILTGIVNEKKVVRDFQLAQNYPNPFNPETSIRFQLDRAGEVKLDIFNLRGELVTTLTNKYYTPGNYHVTWNSQGFASGVYIYSLTVDGFTESKKMVLMR